MRNRLVRALRLGAGPGLCLAMLSACAYQPGPSTDTLKASDTGRLYFESVDNYDLPTNDTLIPIVVEGELTIPATFRDTTFILSHGSGGRSRHHNRWAEFLREKGYATFILDHFKPRRVVSTIHSQVRVTEQQMAADILSAVRLIRSHPTLGPGRIVHLGWSKGATAGIIAVMDETQRRLNATHTVDEVIAFYPYCGFMGAVASRVPIQILHGRLDDYTPIGVCRRLTDAMVSRGAPVVLHEFDDAHHGFDNWPIAVNFNPSAITVRDSSPRCTMIVSPGRATQTEDGSHSVNTFAARQAFLETCAERGVHYGANPAYRKRVEAIVSESGER
ncbi:MAG: dienelactone hydrolase family protein [Pseudomonadota bacterium]